jgi:hypothetical protein
MKKLVLIVAVLSANLSAEVPEAVLSADVKALSRDHLQKIHTIARASMQSSTWQEKLEALAKIKEVVLPNNDRLTKFFDELAVHLRQLKTMNRDQLAVVSTELREIMSNLSRVVAKPKIAYSTRHALINLHDEAVRALALVADELHRRGIAHQETTALLIKPIKK